MTTAAFGNHPSKTERYRAFWGRAEVKRPLVGFSFVGWFPLGEFSACRAWGDAEYLTPEMVDVAAFLDDHIRILKEGEILDDDVIRGAAPAQAAVPWMPGIAGAKMRILPQNVLGLEESIEWEEALAVRLDRDNPWYRKYMEFAGALVEAAAGRFPVSHGPEIGPTDIHALLRGHTESILDLMVEPEKSAELLWGLGYLFRDLTEDIWKRLPLFYGGYFDAQYSLWSPGPIIRMQEDATAVYSPELYRRFVQPVDRMLARRFANSFIHLHSTSMFLLDAFLEIEEIQCYEINQDAIGPTVAEMLPYFERVQHARRPLFIRGSFTPEEMRMLMDSLDPRGLFLNILVKNMPEVEALRPLVGM
ncbi:MAG: hypothetical protein GY953_06900 [bacterium]|nr:hypothetical protein [bacterium]